MNRVWIFFFTAWTASASASTFVGNGGNAGDLDLAITLGEINSTFAFIAQHPDDLCRCSPHDEGEGNSLCPVLNALSPDQVKFCREMLLQSSDAVAKLAAANSGIKYEWSDTALNVGTRTSEKRLVDAVTQHDKRKVIIDRKRFLSMPSSYRIALMAHELFHLLPRNGTYITDEEPIAPFKDGQTLLNTLGAAIAVAANLLGVVRDFERYEIISRAHKKYLVQWDFSKSIAHGKAPAKNLLKSRHSNGASGSFVYKPSRVGYRLTVDRVVNESTFGRGINVSERMNLYGAGMGYHWYPVTEPLSRWSEIQVSCFGDVIFGSSDYAVRDEAVKLTSRANVLGAQATGQVQIPIVYGFWGQLGYQARFLNYRYDSLDISTTDLQHIAFLGGAYGF